MLDTVFLIFFISHIPITLFLDLQTILPAHVFPIWARELLQYYATTFSGKMFQPNFVLDPFMNLKHTPLWFKSLVACELVFQLPLFFILSYGVLQWILLAFTISLDLETSKLGPYTRNSICRSSYHISYPVAGFTHFGNWRRFQTSEASSKCLDFIWVLFPVLIYSVIAAYPNAHCRSPQCISKSTQVKV